MKRICMVVISLSLLFMLSGCRHTPKTITFMEGIGQITSEEIEKIIVSNGNTGKWHETTDTRIINEALESLAEQTFTRAEDQTSHKGWVYSINMYCKNEKGYINYTLNSGFTAEEGCRKKVIEGRYLADDPDKVESILEDLYNQLKAQPDKS